MPRRPLRSWLDPFPALQALRALASGTARRAAAPVSGLARALRAAVRAAAEKVRAARAEARAAAERAALRAKPELTPMDWRNPPSETITAVAVPLVATAAALTAASYLVAELGAREQALASEAGSERPLAFDDTARAVGPVAVDFAPEPRAEGGADLDAGSVPVRGDAGPRDAAEFDGARDGGARGGFDGFERAARDPFEGAGGSGAGSPPTAGGGSEGAGGLGGVPGVDPFGGSLTAPPLPGTAPAANAPANTANTVPPLAPAPTSDDTRFLIAPNAGAPGAPADGAPGAPGAPAPSSPGAVPAVPSADQPVLTSDTTRTPIRFVANAGQWGEGIDFVARGPDYQVALAADRADVAVRAGDGFEAVRVEWVGADPRAVATGEGRLGSVSNYFLGSDPSAWRTSVPEYAAVRYGGVWDGIDVRYYDAGPQLEYDLIVAPGADASAAAFRVRGAEARIDAAGRLVLTTASGAEVVKSAPVVYQTAQNGTREAVSARFAARGDGAVGFALGAFDPTRALVIDPVLSATVTLAGSYNPESTTGLAADASGNVVVVGYTYSADFPTTGGAYDTTLGGMGDAFVTKLSPTGSILWSTYLGGSGGFVGDFARAVALGADGTVYVAGETQESNFPTTSGAYQTAYAGSMYSGGDAFLTKLNASGTALVYSTYLGGAGTESARGVAVDHGTGEAVVVGYTAAPFSGADFPTVSAAQGARGGGQDGFVTRFNSGGTGVVFSTYRGGADGDSATGVAVDARGHAVVAGTSGSGGFLYRYAPTGSVAASATPSAALTGVALDARERIYVTGSGFTARYGAVGASADYTISAGGNAIAVDDRFRAVVVSGGISTTRYTATGSGTDWSTAWTGSSASANAVATSGARVYSGGVSSSDAVVLFYGPPAAPVITALADDTGSSASDRLTKDTTLSASGTAPASSTVTVFRRRADEAVPTQLGYTTATAGGLWTYALAALTTDATYYLTATATVSGEASAFSAPFTFALDTTAPSVSASVVTQTYDRRPTVIVAASDLNGLSGPATVTLDADLNNDGDFADASETAFATGTLVNGAFTFNAYATLLTVGASTRFRARVTDYAGNEGTSAVKTVQVLATPNPWEVTQFTPEVRSNYGGLYGWTTATDALVYAGDVTTSIALDLNLSMSECGCQDPYLVYHSQEAAPAPVVQIAVRSDNALGVLPDRVLGTFTWDGALVGTVAYDTAALSPGGDWVFAFRPTTSLGTGAHTYSLDLFVDYADTVNDELVTLTNRTFLVNRSAGPYGAGWAYAGTDALIEVAAFGAKPAGVLRAFGKGGWAFYADAGGGTYTSPAGDSGALVKSGSEWFYTGWDGRELGFDSTGRQTTWTSADGFETITYTYDAGTGTDARLATVQSPDGGVATFTYNGSGKLATVVAPGTRTTTVTVASGDLTAVVDPTARTTATFAYSAHRLTGETRAGVATAYSYANGLAQTVQVGTDAVATIAAAAAAGVGTAAVAGVGGTGAAGVKGGYTAGTGAVSSTWFNSFGQPTEYLQPDGAFTKVARDAAGRVTGVTDPLGNSSAFQVNANGQTTAATDALNRTTSYTYGGANSALSGMVDALGGVWTVVNDAFGKPTAVTDPLNRTTTYAYSATTGLLETAKDALGQVVTYQYDLLRRATGALSNGAPTGTTGYDAYGNANTFTDALGKTTTTVYDAAGRVLTSTDATGRTSTTTYDTFGRVLSSTEPSGLVTSYAYDAAGRVEGTIKGFGTGLAQRTTSVFDTAGRPVATVDPLGNRTTTVYDALDRVSATVDALGNRTTTVYDLAGRVAAQVDALGRVTRFGYDARGQQVTSTDALGQVSTTAFDELGRAVASTNPLGQTTTTVYDAASQAVAQIDALGNRSTTVYDALGRGVASVDPLGNRTTTVFDVRGRVEAQIDALNNRTTTLYDAADRAVATVDPRGNTTTTVYDFAGRVEARVDALGNRATTVYDTGGRYSASVDALGNRTTTVYDALDRVSATVDALNNRATTVHDGAGRVEAQIDPLGNRTTSVFDALGRAVAQVDALGNRNTTTFDAVGNAVSTTDALGRVTSYAMDGLNRVVATTDPLGNVSSVGYDAAGRAVTTTDALGRVSTSVFDAAGRTTARVDALNNRTTWGYDAASNAVTTTDALNRVTTTIYDALNRGSATVDALGNRTTTTFDAAGNAVSVTDARGNTSTTVYDQLNRGHAQIDALGNRTTTTFDAAGNAVSVKDALGRVTTVVYDALNRASAHVDALGNRATTTFDAVGNVRTTVDQLGRTTTSTYDARNQVVATTDARGNVWTTQYDALGRGWRSVDPLGNDTRTYFDAAGRVVETADQLGYRRSTGYDAVGNATTSTDERGNVTTSTFDALNRVTGVQDPLGNRTTAVYDALGNVIESLDALGNRSTAVYDALNRVSASIDALGNRNTATYDAVGNVVTSTDPRGNVSTAVYDALNRAHVRIDALGNRTTATFDAVGNAVTTTDPLGRVSTAVYDALNRMVASVDPLGNASTTVFDAAGQVSATVDPLGNRTTSTYDNVGNAVTTTDALGNVSTAVYDALNRRTASVNPLGQRVTTTYDARGMVVSVKDQVGTMAVYGYDAAGNAVTTTDALGRVTTTVFDALNRGYATVDALGGRSTVSFDAAGNAVSVKDALGRTTTTVFDALNRGHAQIDALNNRSTVVFDTAGNAVARIDALGNRTTTTFDALNRAVAVTDPLNHTTTTTFDAAGQVTATTDALNHTTSYAYDARGLLRTVTDPLGNVGTTSYDAAGNAVARTDPRGNTSTTVFDALNRGYARIDALGNRTTATFDAAGRLTASIDQLGNRTTSTYDARGRRTAVTDPLNHTTTTTYDAADNAVAVTNPLGKTTTTTFDALNRPTVETDPLGFRTTSTYDAVGNRLTLKDASGNTTTWAYDALDRVTAETNPLGATATSAFDAVGRRASETDRLGRRRDYAYDAAGRRTSEAWYATGGALAQAQTWTYDAANRMLTAQDSDGTYTFAYDAANRATSVQEPFGLALTFGYDTAGNRTSVQDAKGGVTTVAFDALNRQTSESVAGAGVSAMRFDTAYTARSQVASVTRYSDVSGTSVVGTTAYQYDADGRTTSLLHTSAAGATLGHYTYAYDAADRLTAKTEGATTTYAYDSADQLTGDGATTFGYDATGNRTSAGYATGTGNRLSTDGVWTYTHDAAGNLTKRSKGAAAETWVYTYDHRHQMLTAAQSATDGGAATQRVTYAYDAFGVRIERQAWDGVTASTERYGVDGWDPAKPGAVANEAFDVWADLDGTNAVVARYMWGTDFDALAARQTAAGAVQWALADRQGSVRLMTDSASVTQASASYTAFGGLTGTLLGGIGYTGQRHDGITGFVSLGEWRELDTATGRANQTDPGGFAASGPNLYTYVLNGPTNFTDPSGHWIVATDENEANIIRKFLSQQTGMELARIPAARRDENVGGKDYPWVIDEIADRDGIWRIERAVGTNQRRAPGVGRDHTHLLLAALQHNADPHVAVAVYAASSDPSQIGLTFATNRNRPELSKQAALDAIIRGAEERTKRELREPWTMETLIAVLGQKPGDLDQRIFKAVRDGKLTVRPADIDMVAFWNNDIRGSVTNGIINLELAQRLDPVTAANEIRWLLTSRRSRNGVTAEWVKCERSERLPEPLDPNLNVAAALMAQRGLLQVGAAQAADLTNALKSVYTLPLGVALGEFAVRVFDGDVHIVDGLLLLQTSWGRSLAKSAIVYTGNKFIRFTGREVQQAAQLKRAMALQEAELKKWAAQQTKQKPGNGTASYMSQEKPVTPTGGKEPHGGTPSAPVAPSAEVDIFGRKTLKTPEEIEQALKDVVKAKDAAAAAEAKAAAAAAKAAAGTWRAKFPAAPTSGANLKTILESEGWVHTRTNGSHMTMEKAGQQSITVPNHAELKRGLYEAIIKDSQPPS